MLLVENPVHASANPNKGKGGKPIDLGLYPPLKSRPAFFVFFLHTWFIHLPRCILFAILNGRITHDFAQTDEVCVG